MGSAEWGSDSASFASTHAADPGPLHRRRSRRQNHRRGPSVAPLRVFPALPPMKPLRRTLCLALAGALSLIGACSSSPMSRIKAKHAVYETWPIDVLEAVVRPQVSPGMTPAMVEVALGKPTEVQSRVGKVGPEEGWIDQKSSAALRGLLRHTGLSVRGVGVSTGTPGRRAGSTTPTNADDPEIVFPPAPSCAARRHPRLARDDRRPINGPIGCRGPIPPRRPPPRRKKPPVHGVSRLHAGPKVGCDDHCRVAPPAGSPQIPSP